MDIVRINKEMLPHFELILTEEALAGISSGRQDLFVLGAISEGMPVGAAAVQFTPPTGRLISLYVVEEYRMQNVGSALCSELLNVVMARPRMESFVVPYTVKAGEDDFSGFFKSNFFEIDRVGIDHIITVGEALKELQARKLGKIGKPDKRMVAYDDLLNREKGILYNEDTDFSEFIKKGQIRGDLTYLIFNDDRTKIVSCIVFAEIDGELVLVWAHVTDGNGLALARMVANVMKRIERSESASRLIHLPSINTKSENLLEHLFGNEMRTMSISYEAFFLFSPEESE